MQASDTTRRRNALRANRLTMRLARNWLKIAIAILGLYVGLAMATPVFMQLGWTGLGRALYTVYSPFCHQFAFRTIFVGGEQTMYPRAVAGAPGNPYEAYIVDDPEYLARYDAYYRQYNDDAPASQPTLDELQATFTPWYQFASRDFVGNSEMGYKMTLCARDVAIYFSLFIGALLYSIPYVRTRLRPAPLLLFFILGIGPIGIDGFSQLLGYPPFNLWEPRETLPVFRIATGALFGLMAAWLGLPHLELTFRDIYFQIRRKLLQAGEALP